MKTIKINLEYKCYPIWLYDENGELLNNSIPHELARETDIIHSLDSIQNLFNQLFDETEIEFRFKGFSDDHERDQFNLLVNETVAVIESKIGSVYKIVNNSYI